MIGLLRFGAIFLIFYMLFERMMVFLHVRMTGWQFIIFVIVLAMLVEYTLEKMNK